MLCASRHELCNNGNHVTNQLLVFLLRSPRTRHVAQLPGRVDVRLNLSRVADVEVRHQRHKPAHSVLVKLILTHANMLRHDFVVDERIARALDRLRQDPVRGVGHDVHRTRRIHAEVSGEHLDRGGPDARWARRAGAAPDASRHALNAHHP